MELKHSDDVLKMLRDNRVMPKERVIRFYYYLKGLDNVQIVNYGSTYIMHMDYVRLTSSIYRFIKNKSYEHLCEYLAIELNEYREEILQYRTRNSILEVLEKIV